MRRKYEYIALVPALFVVVRYTLVMNLESLGTQWMDEGEDEEESADLCSSQRAAAAAKGGENGLSHFCCVEAFSFRRAEKFFLFPITFFGCNGQRCNNQKINGAQKVIEPRMFEVAIMCRPSLK